MCVCACVCSGVRSSSCRSLLALPCCVVSSAVILLACCRMTLMSRKGFVLLRLACARPPPPPLLLLLLPLLQVIKETSALTFMIAGTVKEVVTVITAVIVFGDKFGLVNGIGLIIVIG